MSETFDAIERHTNNLLTQDQFTHFYQSTERIALVGTPNIDQNTIYEGLRRYPSIGNTGEPLNTGDFARLSGGNDITVVANPETFSVTNYTLENHVFDGLVHRTVSIQNGFYVIETIGVGNRSFTDVPSSGPIGINPSAVIPAGLHTTEFILERANEILGPHIFDFAAVDIREYVLNQGGIAAREFNGARVDEINGGSRQFYEIDGFLYELTDDNELIPADLGLPDEPTRVGTALDDIRRQIIEDDFCFLAGTPITLADGTVKPIEEIAPGDWVQSYDANGDLTPGRVTRTFQNRSKYILDVFGLMVTPGHATYCADGKFDGRHVPMIDILRSDGALMREDGTKVRAATGCDLGSPEDQMIVAITGDKLDNGQVTIRDQGMIRAGTRFIMDDGTDISVLQLIEGAGASISDDGMVMVEQDDTTVSMPFHWRFTDTLPKPEDYILQRSQVTLAEIYTEGDWEAIGPQLAAPLSGEHGAAITRGPASTDTAPPNIPLSMRGSQDQPTMTRAQRRAYEARERKAEKRQTIVN